MPAGLTEALPTTAPPTSRARPANSLKVSFSSESDVELMTPFSYCTLLSSTSHMRAARATSRVFTLSAAWQAASPVARWSDCRPIGRYSLWSLCPLRPGSRLPPGCRGPRRPAWR